MFKQVANKGRSEAPDEDKNKGESCLLPFAVVADSCGALHVYRKDSDSGAPATHFIPYQNFYANSLWSFSLVTRQTTSNFSLKGIGLYYVWYWQISSGLPHMMNYNTFEGMCSRRDA